MKRITFLAALVIAATQTASAPYDISQATEPPSAETTEMIPYAAQSETMDKPMTAETDIAEPNELLQAVSCEPSVPMKYLGEFTVTGYCPCKRCNGKWAANYVTVNGKRAVITSSGLYAYESVTVAADPAVLPPGTAVYIEGIGVRSVQDAGGAVKGKRLDVYFWTHEAADQYGKQTANVWSIGGDGQR